MTPFIAMLRAVNVSGTNLLPMAELQAICEGLGFVRARTYIQSGNVVFAAALDEIEVKARIEAALAVRMGKAVDVLVRSASEMAAIRDASPFPDAPSNLVMVYFLDGAADPDVLAAIKIPDREVITAVGREVYVHYPHGQGRSKLKLAKLGVATARNHNTVAKLADMAAGLDVR